tara:strand:- start:152 stop:340 length:189 start_codon:yes stop_codon:yes gene_type:complete
MPKSLVEQEITSLKDYLRYLRSLTETPVGYVGPYNPEAGTIIMNIEDSIAFFERRLEELEGE